MLTALRGALAFLTRLPVGGGERAWDAFRATPVAFPLAGYPVGALAALPLALPLPQPTAAALYLATLYLVTGVTHADGLADCGDAAAVVSGDRRDALEDPSVGVGGALALAVSLAALALGALAAAGTGARAAVATALAAEVGAKTGMALLACRGAPAHEGLGAAVVDGDASLLPVALAAVPVVALAPGDLRPVTAAAVLAGAAVALPVGAWASTRLGGVSGDVLGATNELGRAAGLHAGVVAWTFF